MRLEFSKELHPDPFRFTLKRTSRKEKDAQDQLAAVAAAIDPVDWLADMLTAPPDGFADFPVTPAEAQQAGAPLPKLLSEGVAVEPAVESRPLHERVRAYFLDVEHPELIDMAQYVREAYFRIVLPSFLFR